MSRAIHTADSTRESRRDTQVQTRHRTCSSENHTCSENQMDQAHVATSLRGVHLSSCPPSKKSDRSQNSPRERVRVVPDGLRPDADRCAITHRPTRQRRPITRAVVCACSDGYADYHLQQRPRSQSSEVRRMPPVMAALRRLWRPSIRRHAHLWRLQFANRGP